MSEVNNSDSSTSESEVSACSSNFKPLKVLYSDKVIIPVADAPMYENITQFEVSLKAENIIPAVGESKLVQRIKDEKEKKKREEEEALDAKNKQRFAKYGGLTTVKREVIRKNVLTRISNVDGPLAVLKDCVDKRIRIKVVTRTATGVRGVLHANLVAFDKQWNLALTDVLEIWKRKAPRKRKVPPGLAVPVPKGTANTISPVPEVTETPIGNGVWECARHIPQIMVRGEHVVLVNIVER